MSRSAFPVINEQYGTRRSERVDMPTSVPWAFAETFRTQAERNHDQTLERLADRGGMSPVEMWLAAHGLGLFRQKPPSIADCVRWLNGAVGAEAQP